MTISSVIIGIFCGGFVFFVWGTAYFFHRYRITLANWGKSNEKLGEALELARELKQVLDLVLEKYPDALDCNEPARALVRR